MGVGELVKENCNKSVSKFIGVYIDTKKRTNLKGYNRLEKLKWMEICDSSRMR